MSDVDPVVGPSWLLLSRASFFFVGYPMPDGAVHRLTPYVPRGAALERLHHLRFSFPHAIVVREEVVRFEEARA